jgi:hypothetical protein
VIYATILAGNNRSKTKLVKFAKFAKMKIPAVA